MTLTSTTVRSIAATFLAAAALAGPVAAETSDAAYCAQLASLVQRYTGTASGDGGNRPNFKAAWAIRQCGTDPAAAIPVLEQVLRDNRFNLPSR